MPAYLITFPKGQGEDVLAEDVHLTLEIRGEWAVLSDEAGPCLAVPSAAGATIQRIDPEQTTQE